MFIGQHDEINFARKTRSDKGKKRGGRAGSVAKNVARGAAGVGALAGIYAGVKNRKAIGAKLKGLGKKVEDATPSLESRKARKSQTTRMKRKELGVIGGGTIDQAEKFQGKGRESQRAQARFFKNAGRMKRAKN